MATKKFGRGGDILTALGAGLTGYGLYKHFTKDKDDIKSDGRSSGLTRQSDISEEKPTRKAESVAVETEGERRAKAVSQGRPEMGDITPEMKSDVVAKQEPAPVKKDKTTTAKPVSSLKKTTTTTTTTPTFLGMQGTSKTEPAPISDHQKFMSKKITTPGDPNKKASTNKGRSENPIQGTIDSRSKSTVRSDKDKMRERALEVQRQREEAEKSRYKKGGVVKSASSRADGIALRGKTRGKVY